MSESVFDIYVASAKASRYIVCTTFGCLFEFSEKTIFRFKDVFEVEEGDKIAKLSLPYLDWGTFCTYIAINKYGWVYSKDTLLTTDYITEPEILSRIFKGHTKISSIQEDKGFDIIIKDNTIQIKANSASIKGITIMDISGKVIFYQTQCNDIDTSNLPKGMYILKCNTIYNEVITRKFLKS